ncbi:GNAT family N-acetyltransferase [Hyphomonas jannaschiana]|uniref:GNAT family N-acetyltransferase n=1 Tax=Hyphomonas jannaschiana TaxID=86 RepID=UPI0035C6C2E9
MISIRAYTPADLPALHAINEQGVPGVSRETIESLGKWVSLSECLVAVDDAGRPIGFLNLVPPGTPAYTSPNLRWFEARGGNVNYVDRIAIDASARGQRIGEALYEAAFTACRPIRARSAFTNGSASKRSVARHSCPAKRK